MDRVGWNPVRVADKERALVSRDDANDLIVSFKSLKQTIDRHIGHKVQ